LRTIEIISKRRVQIRAEHLEIHRRTEPLQLIAKIAQPLQAIIDIEKPRLISHGTISAPSVTRESEITQIDELLEPSSLERIGQSAGLRTAHVRNFEQRNGASACLRPYPAPATRADCALDLLAGI
jgi:hypothetical protein